MPSPPSQGTGFAGRKEVMRGESLWLDGQAPVPKEAHDKHDHDGQSGNAYEEATIGVADVTSSSHGCSILW